MGVRTIVGFYDGTDAAAAMVDSVTGAVFGPLFTGIDAADQIDQFQDWLRREPYLALADELDLRVHQIPNPTHDATDPRAWPEAGLTKLVRYWRKTALADAA